MRWTPERVAALRDLAASGLDKREIGAIMGATATAVRFQARRSHVALSALHPTSRGIALSPPRRERDAIRQRWIAMLPGMKAAIREAVREA